MNKPAFIFYFTLNTLFWGGSFLVIRYALEGFSPFMGALLRVFVAFIFLLGLFAFQRGQKLRHPYMLHSIFIGVIGIGIPWSLLFWGEQYVAPALASIINSSVPVFVALIAPFITPADKFTWGKLSGVLTGFAGITFIFFPEVDTGHWTIYLEGLIAILVMSLFYALSILMLRRFSAHLNNRVNLFYNLIGGGVFILIVVFLQGGDQILPGFSYKAVLAVIYLGVLSTALALLIFFKLIKEVGSVQASAVTFMVPIMAIILDMIFLDKVLAINQAIGAGLVLFSLLLINRKGKKLPVINTVQQSAVLRD